MPWLLINLLGYILKVSEKKKPWHALRRAKVFLWWCGWWVSGLESGVVGLEVGILLGGEVAGTGLGDMGQLTVTEDAGGRVVDLE